LSLKSKSSRERFDERVEGGLEEERDGYSAKRRNKIDILFSLSREGRRKGRRGLTCSSQNDESLGEASSDTARSSIPPPSRLDQRGFTLKVSAIHLYLSESRRIQRLSPTFTTRHPSLGSASIQSPSSSPAAGFPGTGVGRSNTCRAEGVGSADSRVKQP